MTNNSIVEPDLFVMFMRFTFYRIGCKTNFGITRKTLASFCSQFFYNKLGFYNN